MYFVLHWINHIQPLNNQGHETAKHSFSSVLSTGVQRYGSNEIGCQQTRKTTSPGWRDCQKQQAASEMIRGCVGVETQVIEHSKEKKATRAQLDPCSY